MPDRRASVRRICLVAAACVPLGGCAVLVDLLNPQVFPALGLEQDAFVPQRGVVLMVFNNTTDSDATFFGFAARDASDLSLDSRNFSVFVPAGENRNEAIQCPVEVLGVGQIEGAGLSTTAVTVNGSDVAFANNALVSGIGYLCGDVLEVRLVQVGTGTDQGAFSIIVRVIPGQ